MNNIFRLYRGSNYVNVFLFRNRLGFEMEWRRLWPNERKFNAYVAGVSWRSFSPQLQLGRLVLTLYVLLEKRQAA